VPKDLVHQIVEEEVSIESCIEHVLAVLERRTRVRFLDLIEGRDRLTMISTFVGLLELLKAQRIRVQQARPFDDIWIEESENSEADTPIEVTAVRQMPEADAEAEGAIPQDEISPEDTADLQERELNLSQDEDVTDSQIDELDSQIGKYLREEDKTDSREDETDH